MIKKKKKSNKNTRIKTSIVKPIELDRIDSTSQVTGLTNAKGKNKVGI